MSSNSKKISDKKLLEMGIERTSVDVYHVGVHKYSNLDHAMAEAQRADEKKNANEAK